MDIATLTIDDDSLLQAIATLELPAGHCQTCGDYGIRFGKQVETSPALADALRLLAIICSFRLKADDQQRPFDCMWDESTWEHLADNQLAVLARIAPSVADAELRTRLCDIVWLRQRSHAHARIAAEGYVTCAEQLIAGKQVLGEWERLSRAVQIAAQVERNGRLYSDVVQRIEAIAATDGLLNCTLKTCLKVLLSARYGDRHRFYQLAVERVQSIRQSEPNPLWERCFWELAAGFAGAKEDEALRREALIEVARTFECEATQAPMHVVAAHFWENAYQAYRRVSGTDDDRTRVHREMLRAQERIPSEMVPITTESVNISDLVKQSQERMRKKTKFRALAELVFASQWHKKATLREQAENGFREFPFQHLFGSVQFSSTGKVAATAGAVSAGGADVAPERLKAEMCKQYQYFIPVTVAGRIEPMRHELLRAHNVTFDDIVEFLQYSPFIPAGRLGLVAIGIYAGLTERFVEALHVLVPQVEHILRDALNAQGVITSGLNPEGIQIEFDLNRLLSMPETETLLGEDLHFTMRMVFVERYGHNLRNQLAHGMLPYSFFFSHTAAFSWWLILRILGGPVADLVIRQPDSTLPTPASTFENTVAKEGDDATNA